MEDFTVSVRNFGPIEEGVLKIKPMTILLGKNNTGKSYMAMLIHTFLESLTKIGIHDREYFYRTSLYADPRLMYRQRRLRMGLEVVAPELKAQFSNFLKSGLSKGVPVDVPDQLVAQMNKAVSNFMEQQLKTVFVEEMERIFGCSLFELCSQGKESLNITFTMSDSLVLVNCSKNGTLVKLESHKPKIAVVMQGREFHGSPRVWQNEKLIITIPQSFLEPQKKLRDESEEYFFAILLDALQGHIFGLRELSLYSFYLPAARSGILSAHKVLASGLLRQLPYVGTRKMEFLPLSGTITDFLANIIQLPRGASEYSDLAALLEENVTAGKIDIQEMEKMTYPEIFYESKGLKLPIHRSSSMVSEMAPLILYLKYLISPESTLIIEEPESHLHPEAQTRLVKILMRLVNRKIRVIATTHSDFLLQQIQNLSLATNLPSDKLLSLNYDKIETIPPEKIIVYLFKRTDEGGTTFHQVNICDPSMKDAGFNEISQELYGASVRIDRALDEKKCQ